MKGQPYRIVAYFICKPHGVKNQICCCLNFGSYKNGRSKIFDTDKCATK